MLTSWFGQGREVGLNHPAGISEGPGVEFPAEGFGAFAHADEPVSAGRARGSGHRCRGVVSDLDGDLLSLVANGHGHRSGAGGMAGNVGERFLAPGKKPFRSGW